MLKFGIYRKGEATVLLVCVATGPWRGREWTLLLNDRSPSYTGAGRWSW